MITLIATVLNEGESIRGLLDSIVAQTRLPDELIIVDGGSRDNTVEFIRRYEDRLPLKIIVKEGANISEGRNVAINAAQGDILAITDAGVRLVPDWLESITAPLRDNANVGVSCGFFKADPQTTFEVAMGAAVLPLADEIDAETFLPSSRSVALRTELARRINGYPEWLDYCEDLIFDLRLKRLKVAFVFVPSAVAYFRPRRTLEAYFVQYYRYARGDGKADLWRKRHAIRYVTYLVLIPLIYWLGVTVHPAFWLGYLVGGAAYFYASYRRLPVVMQAHPHATTAAWAYALILIPVIRVVGDVAKMIGYPVGLYWRYQNSPPDWRRITSRTTQASTDSK